MTVSRILEKKGHDAPTVRPSDTIQEALHRLASHDVGAVVVTSEDQRIVGIVSERDIVRAFKAHGVKTFAIEVAEIMTRDPFTCTAQDRVDAVLAKMDKRNFRHAPVVADGKIAGIISIRDIVRLKLEEVESEAEEIRKYIAA